MSDPTPSASRRGEPAPEHTHGPWSVHMGGHGFGHVRAEDGRSICAFGDARLLGDESAANARLIAAAPDMLAALQQIEAEMNAGLGSSYGETREAVRAAIAKAIGAA